MPTKSKRIRRESWVPTTKKDPIQAVLNPFETKQLSELKPLLKKRRKSAVPIPMRDNYAIYPFTHPGILLYEQNDSICDRSPVLRRSTTYGVLEHVYYIPNLNSFLAFRYTSTIESNCMGNRGSIWCVAVTEIHPSLILKLVGAKALIENIKNLKSNGRKG